MYSAILAGHELPVSTKWSMIHDLHPVVSGKGNPHPHPWASRTCLSIWIPSKLFNVLPIEWSCYISLLIGMRVGVKLWLEFYEPQSKLSYYTLSVEKLLSKTDNIRRLWYDRAYVPNWFPVPYRNLPLAMYLLLCKPSRSRSLGIRMAVHVSMQKWDVLARAPVLWGSPKRR